MTIPLELIDHDPIRWIERHFYIPETHGPIVLSDYQKLALGQALSRDDDGLLCYSTMVWSDIKKSAKSTITAAVILWCAMQIDALEGWGSFYIVANDLKQADSRVAYYLRRAILLNPALRAICKIRTGAYKVTLPNQTFIEAIPIDPTGEAGSNADMVVFSELWGAHSKAQAQMWTEMTLPPGKFGRAFRWIETYAGVTGGAPILEQLYGHGVKTGRRLDDDLELFDNPTARLFCLWNTQPRLPWQTPAYYDNERSVLLPSEFDRVHRNQWSDGSAESFLPSMALWDACEEPLPPLDGHTPCVLALDAGESNDTFASLIISTHPNDRSRLAVRYVRGYVPTPGVALDFDAIEDDIRDLCRRYAIRELAYDPFLLGQTIRRLTSTTPTREAIPVLCEPFPQGAQRLEADKGLLDVITRRGVAHSPTIGDSVLLRMHLQNADRKVDLNSRRLRIIKRSYPLKIDLAVCLSMGVARAGALLDEEAVSTIPAAVVTSSQLFGGR